MDEKGFFDDLIKAHAPAASEQDTHSEGQDEGVQHAPTETPSELRDDEKAVLLPHEARRALVYLLRQGSALAQQKSEIFELICRYQDTLRNHLENMYLRLVIDERYGVAFIANAHYEEDDEDEIVRLINRRTLTLYDTLLMLVLRKYFQDRETQGEHKIVIDIETIEAGLSPFLPLTNSTRLDSKPLRASLKRMTEKRILGTVRGSEDRYEISPLIRYVVSAEFLQFLLDEYRRLANGLSAAVPAQGDSTDDD